MFVHYGRRSYGTLVLFTVGHFVFRCFFHNLIDIMFFSCLVFIWSFIYIFGYLIDLSKYVLLVVFSSTFFLQHDLWDRPFTAWDLHSDCPRCRSCYDLKPCDVCVSWSSSYWDTTKAWMEEKLEEKRRLKGKDPLSGKGKSKGKKTTKSAAASHSRAVSISQSLEVTGVQPGSHGLSREPSASGSLACSIPFSDVRELVKDKYRPIAESREPVAESR